MIYRKHGWIDFVISSVSASPILIITAAEIPQQSDLQPHAHQPQQQLYRYVEVEFAKNPADVITTFAIQDKYVSQDMESRVDNAEVKKNDLNYQII